jgi:transposase
MPMLRSFDLRLQPKPRRTPNLSLLWPTRWKPITLPSRSGARRENSTENELPTATNRLRYLNNRAKAGEILKPAQQRAVNARKSYLHELSKGLVGRYDRIAHEARKVKDLAQNNLAKSIMDAAWAILLF